MSFNIRTSICPVLVHRHSGDSDTDRDVRILNTIAVALTTGNRGDVFAAAFDKRSQKRASHTR